MSSTVPLSYQSIPSKQKEEAVIISVLKTGRNDTISEDGMYFAMLYTTALDGITRSRKGSTIPLCLGNILR